MLAGLALGLAVAAAVYLSDFRIGTLPGNSRSQPAESRASEPARPRQSAPERAAPARAASSSAASSTADAGEPAADRETRFDFYDILPRYEVVVPEVETVTRESPAPAKVAAPGSYILQTGSFRSYADADRMQASLALLGIESRVQKVTIDEDEFHRVRVGPIDDLDALNRLRMQLRAAGIEALTIKVNE